MTTIDREILSAPAEIAIPPTLTPGEQKQAVITPQQRYRQGIEGIWEKVDQLPEGQDQVVMSQLWEFGKTSAIPTPTRFPVTYAQQLLQEMGLQGCIVGHVGDGNFHTTLATLPQDYAHAEAYSFLLVQHALELGGTATGEHGVGLVKKKFMEAEHGAALQWMRHLKTLFDPDGILNPGKIF